MIGLHGVHNFARCWVAAQTIAFTYVGQHKAACPVNSSIAALRTISETYNPFDVRVVFAYVTHGIANGSALTISWQPVSKRHAVQFNKVIPLGTLNQVHHCLLDHAWPKLHSTAALAI